MKVKINKYDESRKKTLEVDNDLTINADDQDVTISFIEGAKSLKIWVDGQIIYIYPKYGQRDSTDVVFMDKVISSDD